MNEHLESWARYLGGGAIAVAIIFGLAKLFNAPPFKKNGNGHSMMDEFIAIGRSLADNSTKQTALLEKQTVLLNEIHRVGISNGDKIDVFTSQLGIAMERQKTSLSRIENIERKIE